MIDELSTCERDFAARAKSLAEFDALAGSRTEAQLRVGTSSVERFQAESHQKSIASGLITGFRGTTDFVPTSLGRPGTKALIKELQKLIDQKAAGDEAEATSILNDLKRVRERETVTAEERARTLLVKHGVANHGAMSRPDLRKAVDALKVPPEEKSDILEDLDDAPTAVVPYPSSKLSYAQALSIQGEVGAEAKAKLVAKIAAGANEYGIQAKAAAGISAGKQAARTRLQTILDPGQTPQTPRVITQDCSVRSNSLSFGAEASLKVGARTVAEASPEPWEKGLLRWTSATAIWDYPSEDATATTVALRHGSGLTWGRSLAWGRFRERASAAKWTKDYWSRLGRQLKVPKESLIEFLKALHDVDPDPQFAADAETVYIESHWRLNSPEGFAIVVERPSLDAAVGWLAGIKRPLVIKNVRQALAKVAKESPHAFTLERITLRAADGEITSDEKIRFRYAHQYVVTAGITIAEVTRQGTWGAHEFYCWWADAASRARDVPERTADRARLRDTAVPPAILLPT